MAAAIDAPTQAEAMRELVDAVLFFVRSGAAWRPLPHDLPARQTVHCRLRRMAA